MPRSHTGSVSPEASAFFSRLPPTGADAAELAALRCAVEDLAELIRSKDGYVQTAGGLWVPAGRGYTRTE